MGRWRPIRAAIARWLDELERPDAHQISGLRGPSQFESWTVDTAAISEGGDVVRFGVSITLISSDGVSEILATPESLAPLGMSILSTSRRAKLLNDQLQTDPS